jgi:hypothetical protein
VQRAQEVPEFEQVPAPHTIAAARWDRHFRCFMNEVSLQNAAHWSVQQCAETQCWV